MTKIIRYTRMSSPQDNSVEEFLLSTSKNYKIDLGSKESIISIHWKEKGNNYYYVLANWVVITKRTSTKVNLAKDFYSFLKKNEFKSIVKEEKWNVFDINYHILDFLDEEGTSLDFDALTDWNKFETWELLQRVTSNYEELYFIPVEIQRENLDILDSSILTSKGRSLSYISPELRTYERCKTALTLWEGDLQDVPFSVQVEHPELCDLAINQGQSLGKIAPAFLLTYERCKQAVENYDLNLMEVPLNVLVAHPDLYINVIKKSGMALWYIPASLRTHEVCEIALNSKASSEFWYNRRYVAKYLGKHITEDFEGIHN